MKLGSPKKWVVAGVAAGVLAVAIVVLVRNWPFQRSTITAAIRAATSRDVEILDFRRTYFPPGCIAGNLKILRGKDRKREPLITIRRLVIRSSYSELLKFGNQIDEVRVTEMRLLIPPKGSSKQTGGATPLMGGSAGKTVRIRTLIADGTLIEFVPAKADSEPYQLQIDKLTLNDVGSGGPLSYRAALTISLPPGEIRSEGKFGPWAPDDPGSTPVSGRFRLDNMRLGAIHGISGTLSSSGEFSGRLDHIEADGSTSTPDFVVSKGSRPVSLGTQFHAVVNGTDGDTFLQPVSAHFGRTTIVSEGGVAGKPQQKGKTVSLAMAVSEGRIDDLLRLFTESKNPALRGAIKLRTQVTLPPGPRPFIEKLTLKGEFGISGGHFQNAATQETIDKLGKSAQGKTKKEIAEDPETLLSNLRGAVLLENGIATLSNVSFVVPGALAKIHGTYSLIEGVVALHGTLETKGRLSETTSGFKAVVLKAITPFFKKRHSEKIVPFKITGPYSNPSVSLDL